MHHSFWPRKRRAIHEFVAMNAHNFRPCLHVLYIFQEEQVLKYPPPPPHTHTYTTKKKRNKRFANPVNFILARWCSRGASYAPLEVNCHSWHCYRWRRWWCWSMAIGRIWPKSTAFLLGLCINLPSFLTGVWTICWIACAVWAIKGKDGLAGIIANLVALKDIKKSANQVVSGLFLL